MNSTPAIRLAVIDDHPVVAAGLDALFADNEAVTIIRSAPTCEDFLTAGTDNYDVILLDLNIPGESYLDNYERIKQQLPEAKIAAYTSYSSSSLVREALKAGFDGYLLKEVSKGELLKGIKEIAAGERFVSSELDNARKLRSRRKPADTDLKDDFQKRQLLSKREREILHYISKGFTSQHIADELFISRYTVETHRKNILRKLNFSTSTELVRFAVTQGLV